MIAWIYSLANIQEVKSIAHKKEEICKVINLCCEAQFKTVQFCTINGG